MKSILVTGYSGQLGFAFAELLKRSHWDGIIATPSRSELDWSNSKSIEKYFSSHSFDIIFHAAAYTNVELAEEQEDQATFINATSLITLAQCIDATKTWLIYFSTDYVFDGSKKEPYNEHDTPAPLNAYGRSKLAGEGLVQRLFPQHSIFRVSWLYGNRGKNFFLTMLSLGATKDHLNVVNDQLGSPTFVDDLAQDIYQALLLHLSGQCNMHGLMHYSPEGIGSWYDFAQQIFNLAQIPINLSPVSSDAFPQKAKRPSYSKLESSLFQSKTGIVPASWTDQLQHCYQKMKHAQ
jgi:dTDP-4-dehydrorhamnose reductase